MGTVTPPRAPPIVPIAALPRPWVAVRHEPNASSGPSPDGDSASDRGAPDCMPLYTEECLTCDPTGVKSFPNAFFSHPAPGRVTAHRVVPGCRVWWRPIRIGHPERRPPQIMVVYYYVDKTIICAYFHSPILQWSLMSTPRARKRTAGKEPERLLQAKLPADLVKALRIHALEAETTVKELLARLIREYLGRQRSQAGRTR